MRLRVGVCIISTRGEEAGVNHFGFQTDTGDELAELKAHGAPVNAQQPC